MKSRQWGGAWERQELEVVLLPPLLLQTLTWGFATFLHFYLPLLLLLLQFLADRYLTEELVAAADGLAPLAAELSCTPAQLALAWCASNPHVSTVLMGASRIEQVRRDREVNVWEERRFLF